MSELLLGCGTDKRKRMSWEGVPADWTALTTLDMDSETGCDIVHNLDVLPYPFADNAFDEVHSYQVLEHCGAQGDWRFFFGQFAEIWRILKPGGFFAGSVPMWDSPWAWGDPGHRRVITRQSLIFLSAAEYEQIGKTCMTDYRAAWKGNFETLAVSESEHEMGFVLKALK